MNRLHLIASNRWRRAFVLALLASAAVTPALAETPDAAPAAAAPDSSSAVGEIIVTANKRSENLQDVPISIQALTPLTLDEHQVQSFDDYVKLLPSVSYQSFGPGQSQLFFRGISSGGDGLHGGSQPATSTYIDETPLTTIANGVDLHIYDVQRVEALAGPQGTLYGASSLSGTLRIITNQPNPAAFSGGFDVEANQYTAGDAGGTVEGYVNIPLSDKAAIRIVAYDEHDGGYIDNVPKTRTFTLDDGSTIDENNSKFVKNNFNEVDDWGGRAALKVNLDDNWSVTPSLIYQQSTAHGSFLYDPKLGYLKVADFQPDLNVDKWYDAALSIQGKISDWDVLYSGSYFGRTVDNRSDYSYYSVAYDAAGYTSTVTFPDGHGGFLDPDQAFIGHDAYLKSSHELRISSPTDKRFRIIGGAFAQRQGDQIFANYLVPGAQATGANTVPGAGDDIFYTHLDRVDRDAAVFTNADFDILPNLTLTAGIRGFWVHNTLVGFSGLESNTEDPSCVATKRALTPCENVNGSTSERGETHKVSLSWKIDPDKNVYFTYSTGFRPGGVNRVAGVPAYEADTLTNYELGAKTTWLSGKLRVNGAIFLEDWDKLQYGLPGLLGITSIYNAGDAESKGAEANVIWKPTDHWTISGSGTYTDAKLTTNFCALDPDTGAQDCSTPGNLLASAGERLPIQPVFKANATVRYEFEVNKYQTFLQASGGMQTKSRSFLTDAEATAFGDTKGFQTVDFSGGFGKDKWVFQVFMTNAFNSHGELSINSFCAPNICGAYARVYPTKPQFFGAKFSQDF